MLHEINIFFHVAAGVLALIIGLISYFSEKGGTTHIRFGRIFLVLMGIVIITAMNGVLFFRDRPFLTLITIQSFYMTCSGFRALKYKEAGPGWIDGMLVLILITACTVFVIGLQQANIVWSPSVVYYMVGFIAVVATYDVLRIVNVLRWPNAWLPEHFMKMTSAYGALFSAGFGTLLPGLEPWSQIIPASTATLLLVFVAWRYGRHSKDQNGCRRTFSSEYVSHGGILRVNKPDSWRSCLIIISIFRDVSSASIR